MNTEIETRLRDDVAVCRLVTTAVHYYGSDKDQLANDIEAALDEIGRLRAEIERWRDATSRLRSEMEHQSARANTAEADACRYLAERKNWQAEVERLRGWGGRAEIVLEKWRVLCEMGLQDVCSEFVKPSIEQLWELTDELVPSETTKARAALAQTDAKPSQP